MFKKRTGRWVSNGPFFNLYVVCCYSASFSQLPFLPEHLPGWSQWYLRWPRCYTKRVLLDVAWINTLTIIARQYLGKVRTQLVCRGFGRYQRGGFSLFFILYASQYLMQRHFCFIRIDCISPNKITLSFAYAGTLLLSVSDSTINMFFPWETSLYRPGFPEIDKIVST